MSSENLIYRILYLMMWFLDLPQQHHEQLRFLLDGYEDFFDTSTATLGKKKYGETYN